MNPASLTPEQLNAWGKSCLVGHLGIEVTRVLPGELHAEFTVGPELLAPHGYLHAGSVVSLADTAAGCGCMTNLPAGANSFTTIELKANFLGTARSGKVRCVATLAHGGKTTQIWDAVVSDGENGKTIALFRCTQMILYPKPTAAGA